MSYILGLGLANLVVGLVSIRPGVGRGAANREALK